MNTLRAQQIFPFQTQFFSIGLNFQQQNPLQNQCLPHRSSENCEIEFYFLKSDSQRPFQKNTKNTPQIPIQFSVTIRFIVFIEKKGSIINSFQTIAPNGLKSNQSQCTPMNNASRAFQKYPRARHEVSWFERSEPDKQNKTKQTTLLHRQMSFGNPRCERERLNYPWHHHGNQPIHEFNVLLLLLLRREGPSLSFSGPHAQLWSLN